MINILPIIDGIIRLSSQIPAVAANIPTLFDEKCLKRNKLTSPLKPSSVRAMEGITASIQKNNAAIQNPSAGGICTFIQFNKNKYCAVKIVKRSIDMHKMIICVLVVTLFNSLPYIANLLSHLI